MFRLLKGVQKLEYAESFLRGDLYMNTLASFWKNGNESQRSHLVIRMTSVITWS